MVGLFDPLNLFGNKNKAGGNLSQVFQKSTSLRSGAGFSTGSANSVFGSVQQQLSTTTSNVDNTDNSQINIFGSSFGGGFGVDKTVRTVTEQTPTSSQSLEKPISIAPAVFGGGTTTATGKGSASSGLNLVAIAGIGAVGFLAFTFLNKGKKRKKK